MRALAVAAGVIFFPVLPKCCELQSVSNIWTKFEITISPPCDLFFWGYTKDSGFVPPFVTNLDDLKNRIMAVVISVEEHILRGVWGEFNYRLEGCPSTIGGGNIEHFQKGY